MKTITAEASYFALSLSSQPDLTQKVITLSTDIVNLSEKMGVLRMYSQCNDAVGGPVSFHREFSYCPTLLGENGLPIFLFQFVEILDELVDYEKIKNLLPGLSFRQIGGAVAFLRKIAQFNCKGVDIDECIEFIDANDDLLKSNLLVAISNEEESIVLNIP